MAWRTQRGILIDASGSFHLLSPDGARIDCSYEPGDFALEDDLYRWHYVCDGSSLLKHETTQGPYRQTTDVTTALAGLEPLSHLEARRWRNLLPELLDNRQAAVDAELRERIQARSERVTSLCSALPADATNFVFRRDDTSWAVGLANGPTFWTCNDYPWRGKDLHAELARALREHRPEASLGLDLYTEEDWMWYADD